MAAQRVTIVTPQGRTATGYAAGRVGRLGSQVTIATSQGPVTGTLVEAGGGGGQQQPRRQQQPPRGAIVGAHRATTATTILPESGEVRFLDGLITVAVAALTVLWTATRKSGQDLAWAAFWVLLGIVMAVEGRGELRYGGFGVGSANAAWLALRLAGIASPGMKVALVETARIATDGRGAAAYAARQAAVQTPAPQTFRGMRGA